MELAKAGTLRLGLDIDGTITLDPPRFVEIASYCKAAGGKVHIVTARAEQSRYATLEELREYQIPFDAIHFLGVMSRANEECPHKSLDWFQRYLWQKVDYALRNKLTHFIDDEAKVLSLFARFAPDIVALPATDYRIHATPMRIAELLAHPSKDGQSQGSFS